jgi:tetratricopeptide (TPR) repeat protein
MLKRAAPELGFFAAEATRRTLPVLLACLLLAATAAAQAGQNSVEAYAEAIRQSTVAGQITAMEHYLTVAENGILKQDALEVLIWDYTRMGSAGHVKERSRELQQLDPANPMAIAELADQSPASFRKAQKGKPYSEDKAERARINDFNAALVALEKLRKPEGMGAGDFAALRRHVEAKLEGMLGLAYVDREQYQEAKTPLQQAAASDASNAQYAYGLGLALLLAKDSDPGRAFFYLARAVDLTQGTSQGQQIAEFARKSYQKAGGKDADWNGFLIAAAVPVERQPQTAVASISTSPSETKAPSSTAANQSEHGVARSGAGGQSEPAPGRAAEPISPAQSASSNNPQRPNSQAANTQRPPALPARSPTEMASISAPDVGRQPVTPPRPREPEIASPNPPVSLGILIETALLTTRNRPAIISTLRDVVRHLRPGDEAAILVFSNQLDFEQDLTANGELLTEAMQGLRPKRGAALLDGVGFAAGHLKRIGKNANRVLLVISDGRSGRRNPDAMPLSAQVNGVRIDCIGLDVDDQSGRNLLENLASSTGGQATFIKSPHEFPVAASRMTYGMGLALR